MGSITQGSLEEELNRQIRNELPVHIDFLSRAEADLDPSLIRTKISRLPKALTQVPVVDIVGLDPEPYATATNLSFASGRATVGSSIAVGLVIVLVPAGPRRRNPEILAGPFAFLVALSRVYLDVIG